MKMRLAYMTARGNSCTAHCPEFSYQACLSIGRKRPYSTLLDFLLAGIVRDPFDGQNFAARCAHPQSASHGLTLTKANTVIWSSPTYNAEHFQQFNRRIYRAGQTKRTEVICIAARHTWETEVYKKLEKKLTRMEDLLGTLNTLRKKHGRTNKQIQKT